ncbi:MAG: type I-E CRISPR-associated protein Cse1/CasA [Methanomicrobiales archaeon]|nr:type I-E CRISPR-associated protein Cse1/CasA [Methanomicrobiales archaeon]
MIHLLHDAWIPVVRENGESEFIAPHQITSNYDTNPVIELNASRPDFNGALIQFLIGLVQTACPPRSDREWTERFTNIHSSDELRKLFAPFAEAFHLDGEGCRFMQDLSVRENGDLIPIRNMLIEYPASRDMFVKSRLINNVCPVCAGYALLTFQINGPPSGRGHMTGIRGSSPVTCVIPDSTLWNTINMNVIPQQKWPHYEKPDLANLQLIFPWLKTRTDNDVITSTLVQSHPLQVFWGMPNRFFLDIEDSDIFSCDLCGRTSNRVVKKFFRKPYGISYDETWSIHPLSPHRLIKEKNLPVKLKSNLITYRHYPNFTNLYKSEKSSPALNITHFYDAKFNLRKNSKKFSVWIFGYDMDNAKAQCWCECTLPIYEHLNDKSREIFESCVNNLVHTSEHVLQTLSSAIKSVLSGKDPGEITDRFWKETETQFFDTLDTIYPVLDKPVEIDLIKRTWLKFLRNQAKSLFDQYTQTELILDTNKAEKIIKERRNLLIFTGENTKKVISLLGLLMNDSKKEKKP